MIKRVKIDRTVLGPLASLRYIDVIRPQIIKMAGLDSPVYVDISIMPVGASQDSNDYEFDVEYDAINY